jgi:3',5'-cyclic AMP phosphodiesterase CpdA
LHNIFKRFAQPLKKYRRFVTDDLHPFFADDEMAVIGVNTARSLTIKGGRINEQQIAVVREKLCAYPDQLVKVVVTHHPFDLPEGHHDRNLVGRAGLAMTTMAECGADLFLAGHLHLSHTGHTATRYKIEGHSALVVQAGTASSTRGRGEVNSFNVVRLNHPRISVERMEWQAESALFVGASREDFVFTKDGWVRM